MSALATVGRSYRNVNQADEVRRLWVQNALCSLPDLPAAACQHASPAAQLSVLWTSAAHDHVDQAPKRPIKHTALCVLPVCLLQIIGGWSRAPADFDSGLTIVSRPSRPRPEHGTQNSQPCPRPLSPGNGCRCQPSRPSQTTWPSRPACTSPTAPLCWGTELPLLSTTSPGTTTAVTVSTFLTL